MCVYCRLAVSFEEVRRILKEGLKEGMKGGSILAPREGARGHVRPVDLDPLRQEIKMEVAARVVRARGVRGSTPIYHSQGRASQSEATIVCLPKVQAPLMRHAWVIIARFCGTPVLVLICSR